MSGASESRLSGHPPLESERASGFACFQRDPCRDSRYDIRCRSPSLVKDAIAWLTQHVDKTKPFLLLVWTRGPRHPISSAPEFMALYPNLTDDVQREHHANVARERVIEPDPLVSPRSLNQTEG